MIRMNILKKSEKQNLAGEADEINFNASSSRLITPLGKSLRFKDAWRADDVTDIVAVKQIQLLIQSVAFACCFGSFLLLLQGESAVWL